MSKIKYIKHTEKLCFKCLKEHENINSYILYMRGYGSKYDSFASKLQLCDECSKEYHDDLTLWFNEQPVYEDKYIETYKYEDNISSFIESLPIQGREIFENQISHYDYDRMESQDWIDVKLEVAEDEVYRQYQMYTPSETKAYHDRFPTCKHTYLKVWKDGSSGTRCNINSSVYGEKDGSCSLGTCEECYYCNFYENREFSEDKVLTDKILTVDYKKVKMIEVFCPICGVKIHMYENDFIYTGKYCEDAFMCEKCGQELHINLSESESD